MDTHKIGRFIAENRKKQKLTQAQLAEKLGVTNKTVSRWENGNYMPDLSLLIPLSRELEITLNELLTGEAVPEEQRAKQAEESLADTLRYSDRLIRKSRRRLILACAMFFAVLIVGGLALDAVYFAGVPYYEGDVSAWEEQFPDHSAYEMAVSFCGKPVFRDPKRALAQAKTDYSDAIRAIRRQYGLFPLTKYNYRSYGSRGMQFWSGDERIDGQAEKLTLFVEIYGNSFAWKDALVIRSGSSDEERRGGAMTEQEQMFINGWRIPLVLGMLAVLFFCFALYHVVQERKMRSLSGHTQGEITGLVRFLPFRNEVHGDVPDGTLLGWGISQGDQVWGSLIRVRIPPWFPCVRFEAGGKEYSRLTGEGTGKETWHTGQRVTVLYDPENPRVSTIEGDDSLRIRAKMNAVTALVCALACVISSVLFWMV